MSYGSSAYGCASYGGIANSANEQLIYPEGVYPAGNYERRVDFSGSEEFYTVFVVPGGQESPPTTFSILTSHGPGETPQLQVTVSGMGSTTIGACPIILVQAFVDEAIAISDVFRVYGRPGAV